MPQFVKPAAAVVDDVEAPGRGPRFAAVGVGGESSQQVVVLVQVAEEPGPDDEQGLEAGDLADGDHLGVWDS